MQANYQVKPELKVLQPTMEEPVGDDSTSDDETSTNVHDPYGDPFANVGKRRFSRLRFTSELLSDQTRSKDSLNSLAENYRNLLVNIGENPDREGLVDTPMRAAKAMMFFTKVNK